MVARRDLVDLARAFVSAFLLLGVGSVLACGDGSLSSPPSAEPFVYLIISGEPLPRRSPAPPDTAIQSLLLTVGSASGAPFRTADHFVITDEVDGSSFMFKERAAPGPTPGVGRSGATLEDGNFILPFSGSATEAGASALKQLRIYDLRIETEGRVITGKVLIPDTPHPSVIQNAGKRFVVFPAVAGAAAYLVGGDTELYQHVISGTEVQLQYDVDPAFVPANPEFRVIALDSNLVRYMSDSTRSRSGVEGGLGLFGAVSSARLPVPWP